MIAILNLGEQRSYGLEILRVLSEMTGKSQTVGSVYTTLARLEEKGFLEAWMGEPTKERGGRRKRFYKITASGHRELEEAERERVANQASYLRARQNLGGATC